jgi:hypothetical protein
MKPEGTALPAATAAHVRLARRHRARRPWLLIASCLLLVVLSVTLWGKWIENRDRADRLSAELKKVYVEAEKLRTEGAAAKQRIAQLERQLRPRPGSKPANGATQPQPDQR